MINPPPPPLQVVLRVWSGYKTTPSQDDNDSDIPESSSRMFPGCKSLQPRKHHIVMTKYTGNNKHPDCGWEASSTLDRKQNNYNENIWRLYWSIHGCRPEWSTVLWAHLHMMFCVWRCSRATTIWAAQLRAFCSNRCTQSSTWRGYQRVHVWQVSNCAAP